MDNLPEHVFVEILLLLPIKSLLCMRSVCKSWRSQILNPNFVELHMARTKAHYPYNDYIITHDKYFHSTHLSVINTNFLDMDISYLDFPWNLPEPCYIVGSRNGLLCVAYERFSGQTLKRLYLWNPATREVKHIPEYTNIKIYEKDLNIYHVSVGFCFDISSSDYKVVRIVANRYPYYKQNYEQTSRVEVYSLIKDYWKEIEVELNFKLVESMCPAIVKGSIYWITEHKLVYKGLALLSFDAKNEKFCTISLPDSIMCREYSSGISLFEFKESVAISDFEKGQNEGRSIWTLDDDNCWIKKFTIRRPSLITEIVGCLKTGEFVGKYCVGYRLFLYDPLIDVVKQTRLQVFAPKIYSYSQSLVNLNYPSRSMPKKEG